MQSPAATTWRFTWRGFAQLGRISNLPTCFSNILVGFALAGTWPDTGVAILVFVSVTSLYLGGMALNDIIDLPYDAEHAQHRPIVSGTIGLQISCVLTALLLLVGIGAARPLGLPAFSVATALLLSIVLYDLLHKSSPLLAIVMGACRSWIYVFAAIAAGGTIGADLWGFAITIGMYTALLTLVARDEHGRLTSLGRMSAFLLPLSVLPWAVARGGNPLLLVGALPLLGWIARGIWFVNRQPPRVVPGILTWLAGLSLLDAFILVLLQRYDLALAAAVCFVVVLWSHRRILGS